MVLRRRAWQRMPGFDYSSPGSYYITLCTKNRDLLFDDLRLRSIARTAWLTIPRRFPGAGLDIFVVMPNHIHGIIALSDTVGTGFDSVLNDLSVKGCKPVPTGNDGFRPSIPGILRWYKTVTARRINRLRRRMGQPVWQRSYYDHIARSEHGLARIRAYIEGNPANWDTDPENPLSAPTAGEEEFWQRIVDVGILNYPEVSK